MNNIQCRGCHIATSSLAGEITIRQPQARKRKEEAERAIEQAAQSWVPKARLFILQFKFADLGV